MAASSGSHAGSRVLGAALLTVIAAAVPAPTLALGANVTEVRVVGAMVRAGFELKDSFPQRSKKLIEQGGSLYLRLETELWEDRPIWDRLVRPATVAVFRIVRDSATGLLAIADAFGGLTTYREYPNPLAVRVDVLPAEQIDVNARYYLHAIFTVGTIAQQEIEEVGDVVFGRDAETSGLGALGKFLVRKILQVADYLQSESAETTSHKLAGKQILNLP